MEYFYNRAHWEQWMAWNLERVKSGELAETLRKRHMTLTVETKHMEEDEPEQLYGGA